MIAGALTSEEWSRAWDLMRSASELPPSLEQRLPFVQCSGVPASAVIAQVLEMLDANADADDAPEPGRQYGRYMLVRFLGRGGMGEVFQAHDSDLGRLVAIKFVGANARMLPAAVDRVVKEARAASALNHPNLVTVYEFLRLPSGLALVTEFVDGEPLRLYCATPQPPALTAVWGAQIARGLAAAHAAGIVHGDIKPENVMLREDGLIKVLDFGLAQPHGAIDKFTMPLGTIGYMSPEQTLGKPLTGASDIFSLGSLLLELLSGRHPFRDESNAPATTLAINHRDAVIPDHIETKAGGRAFAKLLASMLRKNPADRPTAAQVAAELEGIAIHVKPARKRRWAVAAIAVALLVTAAARMFPRGHATPLSLAEPVPITSAPGPESQPTLSPDGSQVAFIWPGPDARPVNTATPHWIQSPFWPGTGDDNAGVYVKSLGKDDLRRLTPDALEESSPAWSPDGASIAFFRHAQDGGDADVAVVPAVGGGARSIGRVSDPKRFRGIAWWSDSNSVVVSDTGAEGRMLVRMPIGGSAKTALTAPAGAQDSLPAISPDGAIVAFVRTQPSAWQLCRMELPAGRAAEDARCIAWPARIDSLVWAGGPHQVVFSDAQGLWLASMDGSRPGAPVRFQPGSTSRFGRGPLRLHAGILATVFG